MGKHQNKKDKNMNAEKKDEFVVEVNLDAESAKENEVAKEACKEGACAAQNEKKESAFCKENAEKEIEKWKGEYLRKAADFENYRKRMIKEKQEAIEYANESLLQDLINVLDDFDRAIDAVNTYCDEKTRSYMEGFAIIQKQFYSMLENKYSLVYYKSEGEKFDPNIHEAKASRESGDVSEEIVEKELLKGYKLHNRIVRTAQVETVKPKKQN